MKKSKRQECPVGHHSAEIKKKKALASVWGDKNKQHERRNCVFNSFLAATATRRAGGGCPVPELSPGGDPAPRGWNNELLGSQCLSGYRHSEKSVSSEAIKLSLKQRRGKLFSP